MIEHNIAREMADGFVLFSAFKIVTISLDIVLGPAIFTPVSFVAGAAAVASLLFVEYYLAETRL